MHSNPTHGWALIVVGAFFLAGFAAHVIGRRAHVPRVTLLLLLGVVAGPSALDWIPSQASHWFPLATQLALSMVGFMLGERFFGHALRQGGVRVAVVVALAETLATAAAVTIALLLVGTPLPLALLLGGASPSTDAAATIDVVKGSKAHGELTEVVLGVAAVDDAFGILLFSGVLAVAQVVSVEAHGADVSTALFAAREIFGAVLVGIAVGAPMAWLTGRARPGTLTLMETLGCVLLTTGLAVVLHCSYLLASITLGAVVANFAKHHLRPFHAISGISQPFLVVFFLLAGIELDVRSLPELGVLGASYVVARTLGKLSGGYLGARMCGASRRIQRHVGWCLLPQAGVALGLALLGTQRLGAESSGLLTLLVGSTFLFEVLGPILTRNALKRAGEISDAAAELPSASQ